jgi:hypothetical protein
MAPEEPRDVAGIRALLGSHEQTRVWMAALDARDPPSGSGEPEIEVALPAAHELPPVLLRLAVPHEDVDEVMALLPSPEESPGIWWLLERCTRALVRSIGAIDEPLAFPELPEGLGARGRYFYLYLFLASLSHVQEYHRARGISEEISWLTLADLGRNMAVRRRLHGAGGVADPHWLMLHFRGALYALGRLQFQRAKLGGRTGRGIAAAGLPFGPGDPALAVHVPAFSGPLTPEACDASFAQAKAFFARHFPEEGYEVAVCHSWLLDEQLMEYLPPDANILRFQRRFRPAYRPDAADEVIMRFVFGRTRVDLEGLPQRTALERAVVDHLKAGRHWRGGAGWLLL